MRSLFLNISAVFISQYIKFSSFISLPLCGNLKPMEEISAFPCGSCPVENIAGLWKFHHPPFHNAQTSSTPGHLLHYIISGSYKLQIGAKVYYPRSGDMLYYYGSEEVIWEGNESEVEFYSIGFMGMAIPVLSPDDRLIKTTFDIREKWDKLWSESSNPNAKKGIIKTYSILLDIISPIFWKKEDSATLRDSRNWQKVEKLIRSEKLYHVLPDDLAFKAGMSRTALYKLCRSEIGSTPVRRLKEIRIEEAKGLLKYTEMRVCEISSFLGFKRIHDFSREFKKETSISPSEYRKTE